MATLGAAPAPTAPSNLVFDPTTMSWKKPDDATVDYYAAPAPTPFPATGNRVGSFVEDGDGYRVFAYSPTCPRVGDRIANGRTVASVVGGEYETTVVLDDGSRLTHVSSEQRAKPML